MTNDSLKSLGFLKKSLKMSNKALTVVNKAADNTDPTQLATFTSHVTSLLAVIDQMEKAATPGAPAAPIVPSGVMQPPPAAPNVHTVPLPSDDGDSDSDLLTVN